MILLYWDCVDIWDTSEQEEHQTISEWLWVATQRGDVPDCVFVGPLEQLSNHHSNNFRVIFVLIGQH